MQVTSDANNRRTAKTRWPRRSQRLRPRLATDVSANPLSRGAPRGNKHHRIPTWDLAGVASSRDSTDVLRLVWQITPLRRIGRFRRSAKAGWEQNGRVPNPRAEGKRTNTPALPFMGTRRTRADAWDLERVTKRANTGPVCNSGWPQQSQRLRSRHADVTVAVKGPAEASS